jgi:hypothetical protein
VGRREGGREGGVLAHVLTGRLGRKESRDRQGLSQLVITISRKNGIFSFPRTITRFSNFSKIIPELRKIYQSRNSCPLFRS